MNATMTSLPVVPSKFYQVCRLCLSVVNDTNDLVNLSVFGRHNAGCNATNAADNNTTTVVTSAKSNNNNNNSSSGGVIVKTTNNNTSNRKCEARNSTPSNEHHSANDSVTSNNANDNEAAAAATAGDGTTTRNANAGDDDNNNFKIDGDLHQSDILERIYTFLSITVSGLPVSFLVILIFYISIAVLYFHLT